MLNNVCTKSEVTSEKYISDSSDSTIKIISNYIDDLIEDRYSEDSDEMIEVIGYRNDFIKVLEKFLNKELSKSQSKKEFVSVL
jgi:hypothetical protein